MGRFCLDSSKLQEIEALTGSPPSDWIHASSHMSEITEIEETTQLSSLSETEYPSLSEILNERTENFLSKSKRKSSVPAKAKYCTEAELLKDYEDDKIIPTTRTAWQDTAEYEVLPSLQSDANVVNNIKSTDNIKDFNDDLASLLDQRQKNVEIEPDDGPVASSNKSEHFILHHQLDTDDVGEKNDVEDEQEPWGHKSKKLSQFTFHLFSSQLAKTNLSAKLNDLEFFHKLQLNFLRLALYISLLENIQRTFNFFY